MDTQEILVACLFMAALFFIGRVIYRNLNAKSGCASGCNKCGVDFSKIEPPKKSN